MYSISYCFHYADKQTELDIAMTRIISQAIANLCQCVELDILHHRAGHFASLKYCNFQQKSITIHLQLRGWRVFA